MASPLRRWNRILKGTGCTVHLTRGGHVCITCPNGYRHYTGATPSDYRSVLNAVKAIERHGGVTIKR